MNTIKRLILPLLCTFVVATGSLDAQTFNWGSEVYSDIVDNQGQVLDSSYVFELGSFVNGFTPDATNTSQWFANWQAFDAAAYNGIETPDDGIYGYFTSTVNMLANGTSDSAFQTPGAITFENLNAYLWVRNSLVTEAGTEWMLVRADDWIFPTADPNCCGNGPPIEWSTSDLNPTITPVWGRQGDQMGGGIIYNPGTHTLQTATFIPEPSSMLLVMTAAMVFITRRRR